MIERKKSTLLEVVGSSLDELQSEELEATLFESADDIANESPLDTVGLERERRDDQYNRVSGSAGE